MYEQNGNVATITINREKALNALNSQVLDELNATLDAVDLATVRCLVITGAGAKSFVRLGRTTRMAYDNRGNITQNYLCRGQLHGFSGRLPGPQE